jgi:hypothetical protein
MKLRDRRKPPFRTMQTYDGQTRSSFIQYCHMDGVTIAPESRQYLLRGTKLRRDFQPDIFFDLETRASVVSFDPPPECSYIRK